MAPPKVPGVPGLDLPPAETPFSYTHRPALRNPPPPGSVMPVDPLETGTVALQRGPWALSMPSVVALALITAVGGFATSWIAKPNAGDPQSIARDIRAEMDAQKADRAVVDRAILDRLQGLETKLGLLQISQDALRDRLNDRQASGK